MLKKRLFFLILFGLGLALTLVVRDMLTQATTPPPLPDQPQRIISLAPSVTETLFALGLGAQVVGVTRFCSYPYEANKKPKVGGFSDVNYEAVIRQRPDLVALPVDKQLNRESLTRLGLNTLTLDTRSITGFLDTINQLGAATGQTQAAAAISQRLTLAMNKAKAKAQGRTRPTVLFSIMNNSMGIGQITEVNAVGQDGFYNELLEIAGGQNVYKGPLDFPRLSREAILFLNPEVIIDVIHGPPGVIPTAKELEKVRSTWMSLSTVAAIKNNRLLLITDSSTTVPGPRLDQTLATFSQAFYPENSEIQENKEFLPATPTP